MSDDIPDGDSSPNDDSTQNDNTVDNDGGSIAPTSVSAGGLFTGLAQLDALKGALVGATALEEAGKHLNAMGPLVDERLSEATAAVDIATSEEVQSVTEAVRLGTMATNDEIAGSLEATTAINDVVEEHDRQVSEAIDQAGTVGTVLKGLDPLGDVFPMVSLLDDLDHFPAVADPDLLNPGRPLDHDLHSSIEAATEPREPTFEEAERKVVDEGYVPVPKENLVPCAIEGCDNMELAQNAHRYQQTEDGEYICPQCQDEDRTFH